VLAATWARRIAAIAVNLAVVALLALPAPTALAADDVGNTNASNQSANTKNQSTDSQTTPEGERIVRLLEDCTAPNTRSCDSYIK